MIAFCTCSRFSASSQTYGMWTFDDPVGNLLATVGGQAVHYDAVGSGQLSVFQRQLETGKSRLPRFLLRFLAHAGPDIGIQDIRVLDSFRGVIGQFYT